jgi:hypothetical protein
MAKEFCKYYSSIYPFDRKVGEIIGIGGNDASHAFFVIKPLEGEHYITRDVDTCEIIRKDKRKKDGKP